MTTPCQGPGNQIGVVAKGTTTSPTFEIRTSNLTFLIGGGCDLFTIRVELIVENLAVLNATGDCKATLKRKFWNTGPFIGKLAQIKIVDVNDTAPWGYISFDDLRTATECKDLQTCKKSSFCFEKNNQASEVVCRCTSSNTGLLPCQSSSSCSIDNGQCKTICTNSECTCKECSCLNGYLFNSTSMKCEDIDECVKYSVGCQYACVNSLGGYHCACQKGYRLDVDNKSCVDIDECSLISNGGCKNAQCTNTPGSFECICLQGWTKNISDPLRCIDKDECASNLLCDSSQTCINTAGSYRCDCESGYQTDASNKCVDIDECQTLNGGCDQNCRNTLSSFVCSCRHGYKLASNGKKCLDINECEESNGGCQQRCFNDDGNFKCDCNPGYTLNNDNITCNDINECEDKSKCSQICTNTVGGYKCSCRRGYKLQPDNRTCIDVDECLSNNGNCDHNCTNSPGNFTCSCNHGFKLLENGLSCIDVNECNGNNQCQHRCSNTKGSFTCSCFSGYKLQEDGKSCDDINECAKEVVCQHECKNIPGSYQCLCPSGHILNSDNKTCSDINECHVNGTCQQNCTNLIGSFECGCVQGYSLNPDNQSCADINECLQNDICDHKCINTEGSYYCLCPAGYKLADNKHSCVVVDMCKGANCQDLCTSSLGSYKCSCQNGKVLQSDKKTCKAPVPLKKALESAKSDIKVAVGSSALVKITKTLSDSLAGTKKITTNELVNTVEVMEQLQNKITTEKTNSTAEEAKSLLKNYISVASNVLGPENKKSWQNVSRNSVGVANVPARVEQMSETMFDLLQNKNISSINVQDDNIEFQLNFTRRKEFVGGQYKFNLATVNFQKSLVQDSDNNDIVGMSAINFKSLPTLLSKGSKDSGSSELISDVVAIKVHNVKKGYLANLKDPIILVFTHLKSSGNAVKGFCSFINDTAAESLSAEQFWSNEGCWVNSTHDNTTVCMCNHTTSYGLLMDVHGIYDTLHDTHKEALRYISLIGCSISICFCVLTVVALTLTMRSPLEKKARFETFKLHINLVVAIGLSQIWFVIGSFLVDVDLVACRVVSIFTHYFLTASFCWMLVEGINVYNKIVKVFSTKKYGKFYFTLGWGFPLAMVIVTSAAVFNKYGPQKICWLHKDVIWVFAVPVMVVILANFFVLLSVVYVLLRKTMAFTAIPNKQKENPKVKRTVKVTVVLLPLLGLTWVFGFLAIDKNFIVFHYLFAIINSLQGFFIFIAHCWINDSIRSALLEKLPSLPQSSKYRSSTSTKSGAEGVEGDVQRGSQVDSRTYEQETVMGSVPMPVHITMSTVQLLNLGRNSPEERRASEAINDCMEQDNQLPGFAQ